MSYVHAYYTNKIVFKPKKKWGFDDVACGVFGGVLFCTVLFPPDVLDEILD